MIRIEKIPIDRVSIALKIRTKVFIEEQEIPEEEEYDGKDSICIHYLAFFNDNPVATARVRSVENKAKIERVAVLKNYRGYGIGKALMLHILNEVTGVKEIVLSSQENAIKFCEKLGFEVYGDPYYDARIPHQDMYKKLSQSSQSHL
jgi:predicted GNAT family N-acyltransferase